MPRFETSNAGLYLCDVNLRMISLAYYRMPKKRHFKVKIRHFVVDNRKARRMYVPIGNLVGDRAVPKFNTKFELSVSDLDLIEDALRASKLSKTQSDIKARAQDDDVRQIHDLLGRLHNQKVFYRPADGPYVGG